MTNTISLIFDVFSAASKMCQSKYSIVFLIVFIFENVCSNEANLTIQSIQSCYFCNSKDNGINCANASPFMYSKQCQNDVTECYTLVKDNIVYRGCAGDNIVTNSINCSDPDTCKLCSSAEKCNNEEIHAETCIKCDSYKDRNCYGNSISTQVIECPLTVRSVGCYHAVGEKFNTTNRGCMSELPQLERQRCKSGLMTCKSCYDPICNNRTSFALCIDCDSKMDPQCISLNSTVRGSICQDYNDECYTFNGGSFVKRGCLNETAPKFAAECRENSDKCEICSVKEICNKKNLSKDTCIECDSNDNPKCKDDLRSFSETICSFGTSKSMGCYMSKHKNQIKRGCIQDLKSEYRNLCLSQTDECKSCFGKNCNKKQDFQRCYVCDGHQTNCSKIIDNTYLTTCKDYMDRCLTNVDTHGHLHRQCSISHTQCVEIANGLEVCARSGCNVNVVPPHRLQCYRCDPSQLCANLTLDGTTTLQPEPCEVYLSNDQCFAYLSEGYFKHIQPFYCRFILI